MQNGCALLRIVVAAGCAALVGGTAHAQSVLSVRKPFTVKLGFRSHADANGPYFYAGVSFAYSKSNAPISAAGYALYQVYADYAARLLTLNTGGSGSPTVDERTLGLGPCVTYHFGPNIAPVHPFVGAGAGYYRVNTFGSSTVGRLGGKIFAGLELKSGLLAEVDYTTIGTVSGKNAGGTGVRLGYRF